MWTQIWYMTAAGFNRQKSTLLWTWLWSSLWLKKGAKESLSYSSCSLVSLGLFEAAAQWSGESMDALGLRLSFFFFVLKRSQFLQKPSSSAICIQITWAVFVSERWNVFQALSLDNSNSTYFTTPPPFPAYRYPIIHPSKVQLKRHHCHKPSQSLLSPPELTVLHMCRLLMISISQWFYFSWIFVKWSVV